MRRNVASQTVCAQLVATADGSAVTSGTTTVYVLKDGGTQSTGSGTVAHEGNGCWSYTATQSDSDATHVAFTFTNSSAISTTVNVYPVPKSSAGVTDVNTTQLAGTAQTGIDVGTSLPAISGYIDTEVAAIKAKTDNLPSDPADASDVAAAFSAVNSTLSTIAGYVDTEVAAIKAKTDLIPAQPAAVGSAMTLAATERAILARTLYGRRIIYVRKGGNDANDGLTSETAKLTVAAAALISSDGDVILIGPGVFDHTFEPITIPAGVDVIGSGRAATILRGYYDSYDGQGFSLKLTSRTRVAGLAIRSNHVGAEVGNGRNREAIYILGPAATDIVIEDCDLFGRYDSIIVPSAITSGNILVRNCVLRSTYDALALVYCNGVHAVLKDSQVYVTEGGDLFACGVAIRQITGSGKVATCDVINTQIHVETTATTTNGSAGIGLHRAANCWVRVVNSTIDLSTPAGEAAKTFDIITNYDANASGTVTVANSRLTRSRVSGSVTSIGTTDAPDNVSAINATGVKLHATQESYAPSKAGDAMTLQSGERATLAELFEARLLNDGDGQALMNALVAAIGNQNIDELALVAAIRAELERTGGLLENVESNAQLAADGASTLQTTVNDGFATLGTSLADRSDEIEAAIDALTIPTADQNATATQTLLAQQHGAGSWEGGGDSNGNGDVPVDHNYGGTDALQFTLADGETPVDDALVTALIGGTIAGQTRTGSDGRWVAPLMLDADTYAIVFSKPGLVTKSVDVVVA